MTQPIFIGTLGWDPLEWRDQFYPDELPSDWRFCFYSNRLRAVVVPGAVWDAPDLDPQQWLDDSDSDFSFVFELPAALIRPSATSQDIDAFLDRLAPLGVQARGVLAGFGPGVHENWLRRLLPVLTQALPVCVDLAPEQRSAAALEALAAADAALCWRPAVDTAPAGGGRLLITLTDEADARGQRRILEAIGRWQDAGGAAGLFFHGARAPQLAEQARILAELMGV